MEGENLVVLITSAGLGSGSEELGEILMRSFLKTIASSEPLPSTLLFLNGGVRLTLDGSPLIEDLIRLERAGVRIFSCGTCLDYFEVKDRLKVGSVGNMADTVSILARADRILHP